MFGRFLNPWLVILFFGRPVYGKLGGPARRTFFTVLKASDAVQVVVDSAETKKVRDFFQLGINLQEDTLKLAYRELIYEPRHQGKGPSESEFESKWASIWKDQILELHTGNLKFRDVFVSTNYAYFLVAGSLQLMYPRMHRFFLIFQLAILYLTTLLIADRIQFLLVIQIGVFLSFIFALYWYIAYSFSLASRDMITILDINSIPEKFRSKYLEPLKSLTGLGYRPKELRVKSKLFGLMRNYQVREILSGFNSIIGGLLLVGASMVLARLWNIAGADRWYAGLALAFLVVPFFLILGFYIISVILQYSKQVLAPIVVGLVGAALPYAINYTITGEFRFAEVKNAVSSVIAGLGILLTTLLTAHMQKTVEGEDKE